MKSVSNQGNLIFCLVSVYKKVQSGCDNDDYYYSCDNDYYNTQNNNVSGDFSRSIVLTKWIKISDDEKSG